MIISVSVDLWQYYHTAVICCAIKKGFYLDIMTMGWEAESGYLILMNLCRSIKSKEIYTFERWTGDAYSMKYKTEIQEVPAYTVLCELSGFIWAIVCEIMGKTNACVTR
jgi:hypothetical protein